MSIAIRNFRVRRYLSILVLALIFGATARAQQADDALLAAKFKEATEAQRSGQFDRAATAYAEVIKLRPGVAEVYMNYGLVRYEQKQFEQAAQLFEKALELKPSLAGANLFRGLAYYSLNLFDQSIKALEAAVNQAPANAQAQMWLGVAMLAHGKASEAAKHLDTAANIDPKNLDILYHRGRAHLRLSQESYQQMFKLDPKSARVHQVLAQSYEEADRDAEAIAEYQLTIKLSPTLPGLHESLGSLYWKTRNLQAAEDEFQKELAIDPHNTLALYKLGSIRVESGSPKEGLPLLERAVRQNLAVVDAYYYLGKAQGQLGQVDAAVGSLRRVIDEDASPELKESAHYQLSVIYRKLGRVDDARASLASFQKLKSERDRQQTEKIEKKRGQQSTQSGTTEDSQP